MYHVENLVTEKIYIYISLREHDSDGVGKKHSVYPVKRQIDEK